ncbi:MAG: glycosyltransferase [Actinobacteria bacterium]|nr:glycosyltransferase [Actinomycetota bacterium]MBU2111963.1 glycosyltransferase [Actinomycetota bacterium]
MLTYVSRDGSYGGPVAVATSQCRSLVDRGHSVTLFAGWDGAASLHLPGVEVRLHRARKLPSLGFAGLMAPGLWREVRSRASEFDALHLHFARDLVQLPTGIFCRNRTPLILQPHGMVMPDERPAARSLDTLLTCRVLSRAETTLALTPTELTGLRSLGAQNLLSIRNGVALPDSRASWRRPPRILYAARLQERKRPLAFVESAAIVVRKFPEAQFLMVGADEGQARHVHNAIQGFGLADHVTYLGAVAPSEVAQLMSEAQIYVLPSVREPFPMSVLEALSHGLPTIITDQTGISDELRTRGSARVTDGSPQSIAQEIGALLDPVQWSRQAECARTDAREHFSVSAVASGLEEVYRHRSFA